jgi:hypothetical protein
MQEAAKRLKMGVQGLGIHLQLEDRYFDNVAELATDWHIRPSPDFDSGGAAPFQADLRIQGGDFPAEATSSVDLGRSADGSVQVCEKRLFQILSKFHIARSSKLLGCIFKGRTVREGSTALIDSMAKLVFWTEGGGVRVCEAH